MSSTSRLNLKRWIAVFLMAFATVSAAANACAMTCVGQQTMSHHMQGAADDVPPCDQSTQSGLCDFAMTAALVSSPSSAELVPAPYQPIPSHLDAYRLDPRPPLKPPVA